MKVLIIEDETRAANQLCKMLKVCNFEYDLLEIIDTVEESVSWFKENEKPDLVFMDIQLADGLSFEIFQNTTVEAPIIFTTAFDQYAIQAFKVNSIDYLLKPIQESDLQNALNQFNKSKQDAVLAPEVLRQLLGSIQAPSFREGILVKSGNGFIQIKIAELAYCYSEERVSFGVVAGKRYIIEETLDQLFTTLDSNQFFRINRGQIVSKSAILKIEPYFNHRVKLSISHSRDQEFIVSRQRTSDFKAWLNM